MKLPDYAKGAITFVSYFFFTIGICSLILLISLLKLIIPMMWFQTKCNTILNGLVHLWIWCAVTTHDGVTSVKWRITGAVAEKPDEWCLIISNHQSWVDIMVLMKVFFRKVPPFKFFVKRQLIWLPFVGICAWAMDFPFMKRYPRHMLQKNPKLKGVDMETARRACEKFKRFPVSVFNFVEGTRFTPAKHDLQNSPYQRLLKPKAGGVSLVLYAMGHTLKQILNVTIVYPEGIPGLWDFFCGRVKRIFVHVDPIPVTNDLIGNYFLDERFKEYFQNWLNQRWYEKDMLMERMLTQAPKSAA